MKRALITLIFAAVQAGAVNLLQNPGFEMRVGDKPGGWHVYVEPQEGSLGELDGSEAVDGRWSVMLHNEFPYSEEPANNWSQNILSDLSNKTLILRASVKTREASEAALWIQCFRKDPWEISLQKSTADTVPLRGSQPWTPVEMRVSVPENTDFVVVRCVLKGTGTAWFDQVSLEEESVRGSAIPAIEKPVTAPLSPKLPELPKVPELPGAAPSAGAVSRDEIVSAHEAIREANEALRQSNQALAEQLQVMREELEAMRKQIREAGDAATRTSSEANGTKGGPVPPLVPRAPKVQSEEPR